MRAKQVEPPCLHNREGFVDHYIDIISSSIVTICCQVQSRILTVHGQFGRTGFCLVVSRNQSPQFAGRIRTRRCGRSHERNLQGGFSRDLMVLALCVAHIQVAGRIDYVSEGAKQKTEVVLK